MPLNSLPKNTSSESRSPVLFLSKPMPVMPDCHGAARLVAAAEAVAPACGLEPSAIRALAAELAHVAFEREITHDRPWTDLRGVRHAGE